MNSEEIICLTLKNWHDQIYIKKFATGLHLSEVNGRIYADILSWVEEVEGKTEWIIWEEDRKKDVDENYKASGETNS